MFTINQRVVCTDDHFPKFHSVGILTPKRKAVYTIRAIIPSTDGGKEVILLEEIDNSWFIPLVRSKREPAFLPHHFKPITSNTYSDKTSEVASKILEECPIVEEVLDGIMDDEEILKMK